MIYYIQLSKVKINIFFNSGIFYSRCLGNNALNVTSDTSLDKDACIQHIH